MATPESVEAKLAEMTDRIAAVSPTLRPLCNDSTGMPREARRIVRDVCEILNMVSTDAVELFGPGSIGADGQVREYSHTHQLHCASTLGVTTVRRRNAGLD